MEAMKARKEASRPLPRMTSFGEEELTRAIMEGDMREAALRQLAVGRLKGRGINDSIDEDDIAQELEVVPDEDKTTFLSQYAETYVRMHIDSVIEDNYHRIKDDISMILQSHGIGVDDVSEEVSTDAGQPQVHEDDKAQGSGPADGIVEEAEPETILPMDDEFDA